MKTLLLLCLPISLFCQRFHLEQTTSLTIEYAPISLVRTEIASVLVNSIEPEESGDGLFESAQVISLQELYVTQTKHTAKSLQVRTNDTPLMALLLEAQPNTTITGSYTLHGPVLLESSPALFISPTGGLCTGHLPGQGIPISLRIQGGGNYAQLHAGTHWTTLQLEIL